MEKLSFEQALPMYLKLQKVMQQYKKTDIIKSKRDFELDAENKLKSMLPYVTFYGIPEVCLCVYVYLPGEARYPMIDLYVEKKHRNQGHCTDMIRFCKSLSDIIHLNVFDKNTKAISLYTKEGFTLENNDDFSVEPNGTLLKMVWNKKHDEYFSANKLKTTKIQDLQKGDLILIDNRFTLKPKLDSTTLLAKTVWVSDDARQMTLVKYDENAKRQLCTKTRTISVKPDQVVIKLTDNDFCKDLGYNDFEIEKYTFSDLTDRLWALL